LKPLITECGVEGFSLVRIHAHFRNRIALDMLRDSPKDGRTVTW
jgi:hypothetical protein